MRLIRIVGELKDAGELTGDKVFIVCGVDHDDRIVDGEWFGYDRYSDNVEAPFILRFGEM